jgi:hemoglobin
MPQTPSLYERLGGVYPIATVIDDFVDRVMRNPILNANPKIDESHHKVPPPGFKYLVTEMVCWATGGPQKYTGKTMRESHKDLAITEPEWQAFMQDLRDCFAKFNLPAQEQCELIAIVESTKKDIVYT